MTGARLRSSTKGIAWPALPGTRGATLLAILHQLEQSQWWPAAEIEAHQFHQLEQLVARARRGVPFYRARLKTVAARPAGTLDREAWRRIPILTREEVQQAGDNLIDKKLGASHGGTDEVFTSGSTGKPIRAVRSAVWALFWSAFTLRDHLWHRRDLTGKLATIRDSVKGTAMYPKGAAADNWGYSSRAVFENGPSVSLNITSTLEQQAEWLQRQDPDYLTCLPSMFHRLTEYCRSNAITLPSLRQVETFSETLRPETRALCRDVWGVPLVDMYTTREAGYLALQCPETELYHIQSEGVFVEVLDERGRDCEAGQIGRVVVTPLHNFAMPLIRYDIGDYAQVAEPCTCGRGLPALRRIMGRRQNMLMLPDGTAIWPLLSSSDLAAMQEIAPIQQYQFVQKSVDDINLRLVTARALTAAEEDAVRAWVRQKFGHPFAVSLTFHDDLPRTKAGKFEDFVCEAGR